MFVSCRAPAKRAFKAFRTKEEATKWLAGNKYKVIGFVFRYDRVIVNYFQRI
jgi:hypothetical protein